jgi:ribosomal protein L30/L7E
MRQHVSHADTPTIRGMIAKAPHVLQVTHEA